MPTLYDNFERVRQYIDQHQADVDLSSYVSKDELSGCGYLTSVPSEYITDTELSAMGYLTSVPSEYVTQDELSANSYLTEHQSLADYPTYAAISAMGYVTSSDLPVIDENIIPKETATYTLGDSSHFYNATYSSASYLTSNNALYAATSSQVNLDLGSKRFVFSNGSLFASANTALGKSDRYWSSTYTSNLFTNTAYLQDTSYTKSIVPAETAAYTLGSPDAIYRYAYIQTLRGLGTGFNLILGTDPKYDFYSSAFRPRTNGNVNLGGDQYKWAATYTSNLYADTIHNFIWTGTSAEYAALDNYTSYQIYMIKEA